MRITFRAFLILLLLAAILLGCSSSNEEVLEAPTSPYKGFTYPSPDGRYIAEIRSEPSIYDPGAMLVFTLYDEQGEPIDTAVTGEIQDVFWSTTGTAVYWFDNNRFLLTGRYVVDVRGGTVDLEPIWKEALSGCEYIERWQTCISKDAKRFAVRLEGQGLVDEISKSMLGILILNTDTCEIEERHEFVASSRAVSLYGLSDIVFDSERRLYHKLDIFNGNQIGRIENGKEDVFMSDAGILSASPDGRYLIVYEGTLYSVDTPCKVLLFDTEQNTSVYLNGRKEESVNQKRFYWLKDNVFIVSDNCEPVYSVYRIQDWAVRKIGTVELGLGVEWVRYVDGYIEDFRYDGGPAYADFVKDYVRLKLD